jgi:RNA polymerase sigma factor (sigma-70 family)
VTEDDMLAARFEENRPRLRAVAYRMLGSATEADDAVQEAWLRLHRTDTGTVDNLAAWLTTVVGRVCLDMLRSRTSRREEPLEAAAEPPASTTATATAPGTDPEDEAVLADSVGMALLVVLGTLAPVERLAFVLHDLFAVSYDEIAPIVGRSPAATRQLASRARRRIRSGPTPVPADDDRTLAGAGSASVADGARRQVVDAFLAAARGGDLTELLTLLDPDVVLRGDAEAERLGGAPELRGRERVARFLSGRARGATLALIDGVVGAAAFAGGQARIALRFTITDGRITRIDAIAATAALRDLDVVPLGQ